jgi:Inner membrane protein YgaP-like, transmembrane domain
MNIGEKNVGKTDRIIRVILGVVLLVAFGLNVLAAPWSYLLILVGIIALFTGIAGTCALYSIIGWNSMGKDT